MKLLPILVVSAVLMLVVVQITAVPNGSIISNLYPYPNPSGMAATFTSNGVIDLKNPFFQSLGTNGRSCGTCHQPDQGWSIAANKVKERFDASSGLDPIFRGNDGSNCDQGFDTSTLDARRNAYSLLTSRGLIRVGVEVPADAEFEIVSVENPYGCNDKKTLSAYRRPLPSANLRALSAVMWDGRESTPPLTERISFTTNPNDLLFDLAHQSVSATLGHAQALTPPTVEQQRQIVEFEVGLSTAQISDTKAGPLHAAGGNGGPAGLSRQQFFVGINDPLGGNPSGAGFTPVVFAMFDRWLNLHADSEANNARAAIARGEQLFNSKTFHVMNVGGLNDDLAKPDIVATCGLCHDSPNVGNHSLPVPLDIGLSDPSGLFDFTYLPVITARNKTTQQTIRRTDLGRGLITGKWRDIGRVKGPILRGLASRAPYFHNGSAQTLADVVNFYDFRFGIGLTLQEKSDLVAFLSAL
jgi:cytochrome c peroxidase